MNEQRVFQMSFSDLYPLYLHKVERKGRTRQELDTVLGWLTGYDKEGLDAQVAAGTTLADFFAHAPRIHPNTSRIKGTVCGVRVEDIADPLMQRIRWMDKLVDELARGRALEKILRT